MPFIQPRQLISKYQTCRHWLFRGISEIAIQGEKHSIQQPTMTRGKGQIILHPGLCLGFEHAPFFYTGYSLLTAYTRNSKIIIGSGTQINNNVVIYANSGEIIIGKNVLIGYSVQIYNTDFHYLDPKRRHEPCLESKDITIEDNVFIGSNCQILKGVTIGKDSVVGAGSVVTSNIPAGAVFAGVPAKKIRTLY